MKCIELNLLVLSLLAAMYFHSQKTYQANWAFLIQCPVPAWFEDAKLGIFLHCGVYLLTIWTPTNVSAGDGAQKYTGHYSNKVNNINSYYNAYHDNVYSKDFQYSDFAPQVEAANFNSGSWADFLKRPVKNPYHLF